jgi:hypothetical protein
LHLIWMKNRNGGYDIHNTRIGFLFYPASTVHNIF